MRVFSKIDILNKKAPKKTLKKTKIDSKGKVETSYEIIDQYFCKEGDEIKIITKNAGAYCIVIVVENKIGERFTIKWNDLRFETTFKLD